MVKTAIPSTDSDMLYFLYLFLHFPYNYHYCLHSTSSSATNEIKSITQLDWTWHVLQIMKKKCWNYHVCRRLKKEIVFHHFFDCHIMLNALFVLISLVFFHLPISRKIKHLYKQAQIFNTITVILLHSQWLNNQR